LSKKPTLTSTEARQQTQPFYHLNIWLTASIDDHNAANTLRLHPV
jgi:hypothetical protein